MKADTKYRQKAAENCVECGACQEQCEFLGHQPGTPGTIAKALMANDPVEDIKDFALKCAMCGLCKEICPQGVDIPRMVGETRADFMTSGVCDPEQYRYIWVDHDWNAFSLYRRAYHLDDVYAPLLKETCDVLFFPGCLFINESPELVGRTADWLAENAGSVGVSLYCCGTPLAQIGLAQRSTDYTQRLWQHIKSTGAQRIVTACPTCHVQLSEASIHKEIEVISIFQLMAESGLKVDNPDNKRVTVHDSCTGRNGTVGGHVRKLLGNHSIKEMTHSGEKTICCGSGGIVSAVDAEICEDRTAARFNEVRQAGVDICVTYCMACAHRLVRESKSTHIQVRHILELVLNKQVDHEAFDIKAYSMWEGDAGEENSNLLLQSNLLSFPNESN